MTKHSLRLEKSHRVLIQILNSSVFTKDKLYRLSIVDSPNCASCHEEAESIEYHLFTHLLHKICRVLETCPGYYTRISMLEL